MQYLVKTNLLYDRHLAAILNYQWMTNDRFISVFSLQVQRKTITVPVPAGVEDGQTVRMSIGNREVFITFRIEKSNYFKREGPDVHTECTVIIIQSIF